MRTLIFLIILSMPAIISGQTRFDVEKEAFQIKKIYDNNLTNSSCHSWLEVLSTDIGARISGSPQAAAAVEYTRQIMDTLDLDTVWLQPCVVPRWVRGETEIVRIVNSAWMGTIELNALALGNSVGTGPGGIVGEVIEVQSIDELKDLGYEKVSGKIVFFNRPLDTRHINTFSAYGGAVDQRGIGQIEAARLGALGAVVRSMTTRLDDVPHTGGTRIDPDGNNIPAVAISTKDANLLSSLLQKEKIRLFVRTTCEMLPSITSYNVIGEIRGSEMPEEIILVGGHLDSWDVGQGAHDDGAGCVQSIEVLRQLKMINYIPKRTIRAVMFMNEENGLAGGKEYARVSNEKEEFHLAAIESDRGGFTPRGFSCEGDKKVFESYFRQLISFWDVLGAYDLELKTGGSGADISALKSQKGILIGLLPDSQRYFDYHHTENDRFDTVNKRELELGAAAMTSLVYLIDKYGVKAE
jgi:hypothetical protein